MKNLKKIKNQLKDYLAEKELDVAIEYCLQNITQNSEYYDDLVLTKSRYNDADRTYKRGLNTYQEYNQIINKIRTSAIEIVSKVEVKDIQPVLDKDYLKRIQDENEKLKDEIERLELTIKKSKFFDNEADTKILNQLEGYWLELIFEQKDDNRIFSIGEFGYNQSTLEFEYNGKNYFQDGKKYYEWKSIKLVTDFRRNNLYYIYTIVSDKQMHQEKYGFGLVNLKRDLKNSWWMEKGYFLDAGDEKNPKHHQIINLEEITKEINKEYGKSFDSLNLREHSKIVKQIGIIHSTNPDFIEKFIS